MFCTQAATLESRFLVQNVLLWLVKALPVFAGLQGHIRQRCHVRPVD